MISACYSWTGRTARRSCSRLKQRKVERVEACQGQLGQLDEIKHSKNKLWGQVRTSMSLDLPRLSLESECPSGFLPGCTWRWASTISFTKDLFFLKPPSHFENFAMPDCAPEQFQLAILAFIQPKSNWTIKRSGNLIPRASLAISCNFTFTDSRPSSCQGFPSHAPLAPWELNEGMYGM